MSAPFMVDGVGVREVAAGEIVGASVGGRLAGTFVVDPGHGDPLARLLLSAPILEAARHLVSRHRGPGGLEDTLAALDELAAAITAIDGFDPWHHEGESVVPTPEVPDAPPRALIHNAHPEQAIVEAGNRLFYGNPEGMAGDSVYRAVAVAGVVLVLTPEGPRPRAYATFEGAFDAIECWRPLSAKLREVAEGIDGQFVAAELERARAGGQR